MRLPRSALFIGILLLFVIAGTVFVPKVLRYQARREAEKLLERELPPLTTVSSSSSSSSSVQSEEQTPNTLLAEVNLPVPFTSQAPHANWDMPYQEACEEASALMAIRYAFGNPIFSPNDADAGIRDLVRVNE